MTKKVLKLLILVSIVTVAFIGGRLTTPQPQVADNAVYEKAWHWCDEQAFKGHDVAFFELAKKQIRARQIRWSINDSSGLHYSLLVLFAKSYDEMVERESVTPEEFVKQIAPVLKELAKAPRPST